MYIKINGDVNMAVANKEVTKMVDEMTTQVSIKVPLELKWKIDEIILKKKREGEKVKQNDLLVEYIKDGLNKDSIS
jgi:hypothetical protein